MISVENSIPFLAAGVKGMAGDAIGAAGSR
jgi:hypothetical protein